MTDARGRLYAWLHRHPSEAEALEDVPAEVLSTLWADAWQEGGWAAIRDTSELSGLVQRLQDLIDLYQSAEITREVERPSVYWSTDKSDADLEPLPF
jgi:hypothetical protein